MFPRNEVAEQTEENLDSAQERISTLETQAISSSAGARITALETQVASQTEVISLSPIEARISNLETNIAEQTNELLEISASRPIAHLEGGNNELVVFDKQELTVIQQEAQAVFFNLVNAKGGVGIRFYKDFTFGNEQVTNPWSIWIEGIEGYQSLAIIRDWRFTAALWDEDGKLLLGKLDPHPPANQPGRARFQVRGTVNEVQAIVEANIEQNVDTFQVIGSDGSRDFAIDGAGNTIIGSPDRSNKIILHDTVDGSRYALQVTNGQLVVNKA
jgi:uncharacterized coiled-coil protein SlyX